MSDKLIGVYGPGAARVCAALNQSFGGIKAVEVINGIGIGGVREQGGEVWAIGQKDWQGSWGAPAVVLHEGQSDEALGRESVSALKDRVGWTGMGDC